MLEEWNNMIQLIGAVIDLIWLSTCPQQEEVVRQQHTELSHSPDHDLILQHSVVEQCTPAYKGKGEVVIGTQCNLSVHQQCCVMLLPRSQSGPT